MAQENKLDLIKGIIKESTYLFYEMKDVKKEIFLKDNTDSLEGNKYEKFISPLFDSEVIDAPFNRDLLDIIFEEAPFYYKEPQGELLADSTILPATRDVGINDVASPLQTEFWSVLLREAFGSVQNDLLLSIYNKLRYPFIGEQQYLNAALFPELSKKYFNKRDKHEKGTEIEFKNTTADNLEDIYRMKKRDEEKQPGSSSKKKYLGCIDYLEDIVNQKLSSIYAILDYHPDGSNLLNTWAESMLNSGKLQSEKVEREKTIYKLQDIRYELLKRKFAGSSTLYSLALSSINRRGSLLKTVTVGDVFLDSSSQFFMDSRALRILDIPGLLTKKHLVTSVSPYDIFYTKAKKKSQEIPLGILTPLYYTSAAQDENGAPSEKPYEASRFYMDDEDEKYRSSFLRGNSGVINWNKPTSPIYPDSFNYNYTVLDKFKIHRDSSTGEKEYRELDMPIEIQMPGRDPIKYEVNRLDIKIPTISSSAVSGVVLDISLDTILYHRNSLQRIVGSEYDYVTYPLSNNASLSLMDVEWMNFIKGNTEEKSRVQDNLSFGAQISFYKKIAKKQTAFHMFFAVSYGDDTTRHFEEVINEDGTISRKVVAKPVESIYNLPDYSYDEWISNFKTRPKFAYLWLCSFEYGVEDFSLGNKCNRTLISKITLKLGSKNPELSPYNIAVNCNSEEKNPIRDLENNIIEAYNDFNEKEVNLYNAHLGILPFTYQDLKSDTLLSLKTGIFEEENNVSYYDDLADLNYNKAIFAFSDCDLLSLEAIAEPLIPAVNVDKQGNKHPSAVFDRFKNNAIYFLNNFTEYPTANTKSIFYGIRELSGKNNKGESIYRYRWSAPINVINLRQVKEGTADIKSAIFSYMPDWKDLQFFLNPYLNFNINSASPLRHKNVLHMGSDYVPRLLPFSNDAALCSLVKMRNKGYMCNDTGNNENINYSDPDQSIGMYLYHNHSEDVVKGAIDVFPKLEYVDVYGDNRSPDYFDAAFSSIISRSKSYVDPDSSSKKQCLGFKYPIVNFRTNIDDKTVNTLQILPMNPKYYPQNDSDKEAMWNKWIWNKEKDGITVCCNLEILPDYIRKVLSKTDEIHSLDFEPEPLPESILDAMASVKQGNEWVILKRDREFTLSLVDIKQEKANKVDFIDEDNDKKWDEGEQILVSSYFSFRFKLSICEPAVKDGKILEEKTGDIITNIYSDKYYVDNESHSGVFFRIAFSLGKSKVKNTKIKSSHFYKINFIINDKFQNLKNTGVSKTTVNGKEVVKNIFEPINTERISGNLDNILIKKPWGIYLGSELDDTGKIQKNAFYGNIYDLRLYSRETSAENLLLTSRGTTYELYSYSPSVYKLGYNIYKDLGIFKYSNIFEMAKSIPIISQIRVFNRSVWDSILVDMYPTSHEEVTRKNPEYRKDAKDPLDDTDIFIGEEEDGSPIMEDAVQQTLLETVEVINNTHKFSEDGSLETPVPAVIHYNGDNISIMDQDLVTAVTTMIQPTIYNKAEYISKSILEPSIIDNKIVITSKEGAPINLPIIAEKGTLQYEADLNINFMLDGAANLSTMFLAGSNIQTIWNTNLDRACVCVLEEGKDRIKPISSSQNNFILTPFTLPDQTKKSWGNFVKGKLTKINLRGTQLNLSINSFLRAINYYTEVRIPQLISSYEDPENSKYASKWLAVRTLKEGSYYFTYKYPLQILPFSEKDMQSSNSAFNTYYATARFKIEVKGTPIKYDSETYGLNAALGIYKSDTIRSTFNSDTCIEENLDNRTFPHRLIDIDLYVMDFGNEPVIGEEPKIPTEEEFPNEEDFAAQLEIRNKWEARRDLIKEMSSGYSWKLIGSNHNYLDDPEVIKLDKKALGENIDISVDIPAFLAGSYNSPYFVAGTNEDKSPNPGSIKDDRKDLITVEAINSNFYEDKLYATTIEDFKDQKITAGRSYKLLFDYEAQPAEISYNSYVEKSKEKKYDISFEEYRRYPENFSLLQEDGNPYTYIYRISPGASLVDRLLNSNLEISTQLEITTAGFETTGIDEENGKEIIEKDENGNYRSIISNQSGWAAPNPVVEVGRNKISLGNPYSSSITENMLLRVSGGAPTDLDESYSFPYMPTEVPASMAVTIRDKKELRAVDNFISTSSKINISEDDIVRGVGQRRQKEVTSAISNLKKSVSGIFSQLSVIFPSISYISEKFSTKFTPEDYSYITSSDYSLFSYDTTPVSIKKNSNQINIRRYSLYQNNILLDQNFNHWTIFGTENENKGNYISDYLTVEKVVNNNVIKTVKSISAYEMNFAGGSFIQEMSISKNVFEIPKKDYFEVAVILEALDKDDKPIFDNISVSAICHGDGEDEFTMHLDEDKTAIVSRDEEGKGYIVYTAVTPKDISLKSLEIHIIEKGIIGKPTPKKIKLYKIFLRRGVAHSHILGLADTLISNEIREDDKSVVRLGNYAVIAFKKNTDKYIHNYIPVMFEGEKTNTTIENTNLITVDPEDPSTFINKNSVPQAEKRFQTGFFTEGLTQLRQPWLRTVVFKEGKQIGVDENGKFIYDKNKVEILKENLINGKFERESGNSTDIFESVDITYDNNPNNPNLSIGNLKINVVPVKSRVGNYDEYMLSKYRMNLRVNATGVKESIYTPATLINERISGLTNCFHGENFATDTYKAKSSLVEITNIQLLTPEKPTDPSSNNILFCELEYLPIIYDEAIHHISFNGMFHQVSSRNIDSI